MKKITLKLLLILPFILLSGFSFSQTTVIASDDSYTWDTNPNGNYGSNRLIVSYDSDNTSHNRDTYLKFNIASIPVVANATLRLNLENSSGATRNYTAYLVNDSWSNGGITWNNAPAVIGSAIATGSNSGSLIEFDLTTVVSDHRANGETILSIKIVSFEEDILNLIYSTNTAASNATKPRLVINDPTLSIENNFNANSISVFPNPTVNNLYVNGLTNEKTTIQVYNTLGQLLKQELYNTNVDFSVFVAGIYFVKVINGIQEKTFRIVKK